MSLENQREFLYTEGKNNSTMDNSDERMTVDEVRLELIALRSMKNEELAQAEKYKGRVYLKVGVVLGLLYGLIGNLAVVHWYGVFEGLETKVYGNLFWANVAVTIVAIIVIIGVTIQFRKGLGKDATSTNRAEDQAKLYQNIIQKRELLLERLAEKTGKHGERQQLL